MTFWSPSQSTCTSVSPKPRHTSGDLFLPNSREIARAKGVQQTDVLSALGLQWGLVMGCPVTYPKESARIAMCRERLKRLAHLPANLATQVQAIVTGCLSLLTYSVMPEPKHAPGLRISVRHALNQSHGAPEALFHLFCKTSCDPLYAWIMACCRLLHTWLQDHSMPSLAELRAKKALLGRITSFLRWAKRAGWVQMRTAIEVPMCGTIHLDRVWVDVRQELKDTYRRHAARELVKRRPHLYDGLKDWNSLEHRKLLTLSDSHTASILCRIWTGCAMTASHAFTVGKSASPLCRCGLANETIFHLVFECALQPPCPVYLLPWKERPPSQSRAMLAPYPCNKDDRDVWRKLCRRAVSTLSRLHPHEEVIDWRGHEVLNDLQAEYVYCIRCLQCRKAKDAKHLASKPCDGLLWGSPLSEGQYTCSRGHFLRMEFRPWKIAARRPSLRCVRCEFWTWPPYPIHGCCPH